VGLLRASSEQVGQDVDLEATVGRTGGGGIEHGDALVRFAEAVTRGTDDVDTARAALRETLGEDGFVEASGIVGIFNGLVRTADLSGIPLDDDTLHGSIDFREGLGLNTFAGAANSDLDRADPERAPKRIFAPPSG
jgi:hypothetical protein